MVDLHLHSRYSDGDLLVPDLIREVARRGLTGFSLTDHNGLWGADEAAAAAARLGLDFIEGIEISARWRELDIHLLGYSRAFHRQKLAAALAATRAGYAARARKMIAACRQHGFAGLSFDRLAAARSGQPDPVFMSYDVARELTTRAGLTAAAARALTTTGGVCHVPYGDWAMAPAEAIAALHAAGGVAVLAHPGLIAADGGDLPAVLQEIIAAGADGLEIYHPYHDDAATAQLRAAARDADLIVTGGSDWHGPGRYPESDRVLGRIGLEAGDYQNFLTRLEAL